MSRILIAEGNTALASRLSAALEEAGYRTEQADDGETALFLARAAGFDRLILGADLPLLAGPEVLAQVRSEGVRTPAIVLTRGDADGGNEHGAGSTRHLSTPFLITDLLALVRLP